MSRYGTQVRAIADMTAADEREYGFALSGEPGALDTTGIIRGNASSVNIYGPTSTSLFPTVVGVHTHPSGITQPSVIDLRGFLMLQAQYPADGAFPDGWRRGVVAVAREPGSPPMYEVTSIELTTEGAALSRREQSRLVDRGFAEIGGNYPGILGVNRAGYRDVVEALKPYVRVCSEVYPPQQQLDAPPR
jgi:hypothetical protein